MSFFIFLYINWIKQLLFYVHVCICCVSMSTNVHKLICMIVVSLLIVRVGGRLSSCDNTKSPSSSGNSEPSWTTSFMDLFDVTNLIYAIITLYLDLGHITATSVLLASMAIAVVLAFILDKCYEKHKRCNRYRTIVDKARTGFNTAKNVT